MKARKTRDEWEIQANYGFGHGWETEVTEDSRVEGRERLKEHRENMSYPVRMVKRRVRIEAATVPS